MHNPDRKQATESYPPALWQLSLILREIAEHWAEGTEEENQKGHPLRKRNGLEDGQDA